MNTPDPSLANGVATADTAATMLPMRASTPMRDIVYHVALNIEAYKESSCLGGKLEPGCCGAEDVCHMHARLSPDDGEPRRPKSFD